MSTRVCAEYLALTIARREGYTPRDSEHLAQMTGLPLMHVARLIRSRDPREIPARRAYLNRITEGAS